MTKLNFLVASTLVTLLAVVGCGTNNQLAQVSGQQSQAQQGQPQPDPITTGFVDLVFLNTEPPEEVDSIQKVFRDASGAIVFGPVEHDLNSNSTITEGVPTSATQVEIDYLQNGGLALFESVNELEFQDFTGVNARGVGAAVVDPTLQAAGPSRSVWTSSVVDGNGKFFVATQGNPGRDTGLSSLAEFTVKGVCYSPASIGGSNKFGPNVGDYFWDSFKIPDGRTILDWDRVWKRDLGNIRKDFNSLRTYCMIAYQTNAIQEGFANAHLFTHHKFLDECWNNGKDPVFVLVGIPLPGTVMLPGFDGNPEKEFWEANFGHTVTSLGNHPAVMGFTIFNEQGDVSEWGTNEQRSQFYWGQIKRFSEQAKSIAPDKLVGFAWFDNPSAVAKAVEVGLPQQFGGSLDFYGLNSFQSTTVKDTLEPYMAMGSAAKPVLFTEFGLAATTRTDTSTCAGPTPTQASVNSIITTPASIEATANALQFIIPIAMQTPIVAGMMYFEWNDEWWKQEGADGCFTTQIDRQEGGMPGGAFPNGYNDEEGFGLHSIALNGRTAGNVFDPFDRNAATANNKPDILTKRTPMYDAVKNAFAPVR